VKIPVGECIGHDVHDVTVAQLEAACEKVEAELCGARQNTYKSRKAREFVLAARRLLKQRKFPTGSYETTADANRALRDAVEIGWLIAPSDQVARVLDGTAIVISSFRAEPTLDTFPDDDDPKYRIPAKPMLDRIANHLGLSWDAANCRRTDNQSSPYVRSCQAAGFVKGFDGSPREVQAHAEVDLHPESSLTKAILGRFSSDRTKGRIELERRRQFILSHADTSARLRAIKQLGLREKYLPSELAKPFFVAKVQFTGKSENEATQAVFAARVADTFLPASAALFGQPKKAAAAR